MTIPASDQKCLRTALRLLGRRDHSRSELADKLRQRGFETDPIERVIVECERMHYLDDARFCHNYTVYLRRKGYGVLRIAQMLKKKGLSETLLTDDIMEQCDPVTQVEDCRQVLMKKMKDKEQAPLELVLRARLYRFLLNRGFSSPVIHQVLSTYPSDHGTRVPD